MLSRLQRQTDGKKFIPEIDGLRFFAIFSVLIYHANTTLSSSIGPGIYDGQFSSESILHWGWWLVRLDVGVKLFFSISGFVLAIPLIEGYAKGKSLNIKAYFYRRLTRLEPPYIVSLVGFYLYHLVFEGVNMSTFLLTGVFYVHGLFFGAPNPINPVSWSLEVETQFYLLVPLLFLGLKWKAGAPRLVLYIVLVIVAGVAKHLVFQYQIFPLMYSVAGFLVNFLVGVLFALTYNQFKERLIIHKSYLFDIVGLVSIFCMFWFYKPQSNPTNILVLNISIFAFLVVVFKGKLFNMFVRLQPVYVIGGMCYSIYLIHYAALKLLAKFTSYYYLDSLPYFPNLLLQCLVLLPLVIVVSTAFFIAIEKPCMDKNWPTKLWDYLSSKTTMAK